MIQNAKDTFYITLRDRLVVANAQRTTLLRGATRPGILVEEAETVLSEMLQNVFVLRWTQAHQDASLPQNMSMMDCEIHYGTTGTTGASGLDRARLLAAMDAELLQMLQPASTPTLDYSAEPAAATGTTVFWTDAVMGPTVTKRDLLTRMVTVTVIGREAGGDK